MWSVTHSIHDSRDREMHWIARVIVICFLVFLSLAAFADTLTGKVVKITDGDTSTSSMPTMSNTKSVYPGSMRLNESRLMD